VLGAKRADATRHRPYTVTKGAVKTLTKGMAVDLGRHGIPVNGLGPGYFKPELTQALVQDENFTAWLSKRKPAGRWGEMHELAGAVIFLSSDASSRTGAVLAAALGLVQAFVGTCKNNLQ
jgi:NAD(P)-dependent dehydrogenase (short-subunit alcohol dehydrogenase family)